MSLNWKEINHVLGEIPLKNSFIRQIHQPHHPVLIFELYNHRQSFRLFFSFSNPHCRLHLISRRLSNPSKPQRFASFLRSRTRGGRVLEACQIGRERIIKIEVLKGETKTLLMARLWAGSANMIATDEEGNILDALYRRPKRHEITGGVYQPEKELIPAAGKQEDTYTIRELPGEGSFNEKLENYYFQLEQNEEEKKLICRLTRQLSGRENRIEVNIESLKKKLKGYGSYEELKTAGDLILSNIHRIQKGDHWLVAEQIPGEKNGIELDPGIKPAENAERYYTRYRKAKSGRNKLIEEIREQEKHLERIRKKIKQITDEHNIENIRSELQKIPKQVNRQKEACPGLSFSSSDFQILIGRTSKENDMLLRKFVRGNDTWFHARDYPGAYVFIRSAPGKSIPLDVMLDAGNLAVFYSKGKSSGQGNVYYTKVKYLRRAKKGKTGLVIPTQEKNLFIKIDQSRIDRLRGSFG